MHGIGPPSAGTGTQGWQMAVQPSGASNSPPMGTIPLNTVIGYIVQKTYHDIVVMADLLPGKSDMERKIDIAHFANRTRQLFIRLLAVVKWAGSVNKVMKCEEITQLLDQQAMLFIDTADKLHTLANQLVVQARLPNFAIPAAVDVLTTGAYTRLPKAIRDKVIPPDPVTPTEKAITLKRLNEIIMHRLVLTKIPLQIADLTVDKGIAKLTVPGEFKALLTLMGDTDEVPWRLLKLEFMVSDKETGGGRALVHDLQINYIHELVQSRLIANENSIKDLYEVLHSFCLSLKIEVLQTQTIRLIQKRWGRLVKIDEYQPGIKVVLSYWRLSPYKSAKPEMMNITVQQTAKDDGSWVLDVMHKPLLMLEDVQLVENASKIADLSFERLLSDTIAVRSFHKLYDLRRMLQKHIRNDVSVLSDDKSCLVISLVQPCQDNENLVISVDPQTGVYIPTLASLDKQTLLDLEQSINESSMNILSWIPNLRIKLTREHCKSVIQNLPALYDDNFSLTNKLTHFDLAKELVCLKLTNFNQYYIIVELLENGTNPLIMMYKFHLLNAVMDPKSSDIKTDMLIKIDKAISDDDDDDSSHDDVNSQHDLNSELAWVISLCDARVPFISLTHELTKEGLLHQGVLDDGINVGLCLKLITFPDIASNIMPVSLREKFLGSILDCGFRLLDKSPKLSEAVGMKFWHVELVFSDNPLKGELQHGSEITRTNIRLDSSDTESSIKLFKDEWAAMSHLYDPVVHFAKALEDEEGFLKNITSVHSYDYRSLMLKYGPNKGLIVTIKWSVQNEKFVLLFGRCDQSSFNSHAYASHYFNNLFNSDPDIGKLVHILHDTCEPLRAVCSLVSIPLMGMGFNQLTGGPQNAKTVSDSFVVVIQTVSHYRLVYRSTFCLDVYCLPDKKIALRDGSLSKFDTSKVKEGLLPIPGLMSFLSMFERRGSHIRSRAENDNPPLVDMTISPGSNPIEQKSIPPGHWAGSTPAIIEHEIFAMLVKEQPVSNQSSMSLLEHFLGLALIRRELEKISQTPSQDYYIPTSKLVPNLPVNDALNVVFAVNSLMFKCSMTFTGNRPSLLLKVLQVPPLVLQERNLPTENWRPESLRLLEQFFRIRVAIYPFRTSNAQAFCTIISSKSNILLDFIHVMHLELSPSFQNDPSVRWIPQLCLTVPPKLNLAPTGVPAIYIRDKILVFLLMKERNAPQNTQANRQSIILPIVWRPQINVATLSQGNPLLARVEFHLQQWMQRRQPNTDILMSNAVKYLMDNFTIQ